MWSVKLIIYTITIFLLIPRVSSGQEVLSFDQMWELTLEHNLDIENARLDIDRVRKMKKSSWDPGKTSFNLQRGQINSALIDNQYTIHQEIGSPFEMASYSKYYRSEMGLYSRVFEKIRRNVKKDLRSNYYEWLYENEKQKIIERALELYKNASDYADIQLQTGETNLLSKVMIDSEWQGLNLELDAIKVSKSNLLNEINVIVNADIRVLPDEDELYQLMVPQSRINQDFEADSIPEISIEKQKIEVAGKYLGLTRSRISPYFSAGYFNQDLDNVPGFEGWQVGIAFPLWFFPQKSRVQAASIDLSIAENNYQYRKYEMENKYRNMINRFNQLEDNIDFYENQHLDNARLIEENANELYENGEIGYLEFVQNINAAIRIYEDYYRLVNNYNQLVIDMYYYLDI